jgi:hypothetical protein
MSSEKLKIRKVSATSTTLHSAWNSTLKMSSIFLLFPLTKKRHGSKSKLTCLKFLKVKKFPALFINLKFIAVYTTALYFSLSWSTISETVSLRPTLMLSYHLRPGPFDQSSSFRISSVIPVFICLLVHARHIPPYCHTT